MTIPKFKIGQVVIGISSKDIPGCSQNVEFPTVVGRVETIFIAKNSPIIYNVSTCTMAEHNMQAAPEFEA